LPELSKPFAALAEETAIVDFVPDGQRDFAYRTETFCTVPLPADAKRLVIYTSDEIAAIKRQPAADTAANFWMGVDLTKEDDIPHGVGHMVVYGIPAQCPECKKANLQVTNEWLTVKCPNCGHTEHHTQVADGTWIATWSEIH